MKLSLKDSNGYEMKLLKGFLKGSFVIDHTVHQELEPNPEVLVPATQEFFPLATAGTRQ